LKYTRAKPSEFAAHHLAYIPKVIFWLQQATECNLTHQISLATTFRRVIKTPSESLPQPKCSRIYAENSCRKSGWH
jgi:hypothetical protein